MCLELVLNQLGPNYMSLDSDGKVYDEPSDHKKIKVHLVYWENSAHLQQIFTGFSVLARKGLISLSYERSEYLGRKKSHIGWHLADMHTKILKIVINDSITAYYDTHDSWEVDPEDVKTSDFYFKRSYKPHAYAELGDLADKIKPLGLNYFVLPDWVDDFYLERSNFTFKQRVSEHLYRYFPRRWFLKHSFLPTIRRMEQEVRSKQPAKVLYMVRTWDPYDDPLRPPEKIQMRDEVNEMRAQCIRALRKELGNKFYGGFSHTDYAKRYYRDLLVCDHKSTGKGSYIAKVLAHPICIASTGLHGSTGWKLGEYIAFSRAIVSEPLNYQSPGDFSSPKNYLEFSSSNECVDQCVKLIEDKRLRIDMMYSNREYYVNYLYPGSLVLNTLRLAVRAS